MEDHKKNFVDDFSFKEVGDEIKLLTSPLPFDVVKAPDSLQLELTDLESNKGLKQKLKYVKCAYFFLLVCDPEYWKVKGSELKMLSMLASTYKCEQTIPLMKVNKSHLKVWMRDEYSAVVLSTHRQNLSHTKLWRICQELQESASICHNNVTSTENSLFSLDSYQFPCWLWRYLKE